MFLNIKFLTAIFTCFLLSTSWLAYGEDEFTYPTPQQATDNDVEGLEQTLEHNFSPEDRARLRKALADYAKNTDPEHEKMEAKRRAMKANIAERFNQCNDDNDDSLDRYETTKCLPQVARHFNYVDVDQDNVITLEELELAHAKSIKRKKEAEAKIEAKRIAEAEARIKAKKQRQLNKQAANGDKKQI